jgi:hypothetical protein
MVAPDWPPGWQSGHPKSPQAVDGVIGGPRVRHTARGDRVEGDPSLSGYPKDVRAWSCLRSARITVGEAVKLETMKLDTTKLDTTKLDTTKLDTTKLAT